MAGVRSATSGKQPSPSWAREGEGRLLCSLSREWVGHRWPLGAHGTDRCEAPLGWIPLRNGGALRSVLLLDPCSARCAGELRVHDTSVLVNLAKEVLTVDQLKRTPPQGLEGQTKELDLLARPLGYS